jgi:hypothetical protein
MLTLVSAQLLLGNLCRCVQGPVLSLPIRREFNVSLDSFRGTYKSGL